MRSLAGLAAFLAVCLAVAAAGGAITSTSVETWYPTLQKPAFNPPAWVFGPVWTTLYLMIGVAGWRVWRLRGFAGARAAMIVYALQLALNFGWSLIFFGQRMIGLAFLELLVLLGVILVNLALFWRIDRLAGGLLAPYAAWVAFAGVLNFSIWRLN